MTIAENPGPYTCLADLIFGANPDIRMETARARLQRRMPSFDRQFKVKRRRNKPLYLGVGLSVYEPQPTYRNAIFE